jgi:hypothetical protein
VAKTWQEAVQSNEAMAEFDRGIVFGEAFRECEHCGRDIHFMLCQGRTQVFVVITHVGRAAGKRYRAGVVDGQYSEKGKDNSVKFVMERTLVGLLRECACTSNGRIGALW